MRGAVPNWLQFGGKKTQPVFLQVTPHARPGLAGGWLLRASSFEPARHAQQSRAN
jgi:hypothetical protein